MQKGILLQDLDTKSGTVNNAIIQLGDIDDSGKGRHFKSRFIQPGVAGYPGQFGNVLITKESLDKFIDTMVGVPVIVNHKSLNNNNVDDERVGVVNSVWYDDKDGWYWCDGIIWDSKAQKLITDKGWSVSCSYDVKTADDKGGTENNIKYDMEFLDGVFTHLALVNNPRYERANIVLNSKDTLTEQFTDIFFEALAEVIVENGLGESVENEKWITIHPHGDESEDYRRLKLEDGESPKEAIDRVYKKEDKKQFDTKDKQSDTKEEKKETSDSPFGEGVEITESDKKGYMLDSKNLKSYRKGDKFAIVDDWSHDDKDRYTVSFHDGKKTLDRKTYSTKRGMEKAIREHLQGGPNKETKALETKSNLEEKENTYKEVLQRYNENDRKRWSSGLSNEEYHKAWAEAEKAKKELTTARREYAESIMANFETVESNPYEEKQEARRARYEELSDKASRESEQAHQAFRDKMSVIPMGQPILVGHHSEQRDRRYREKAWDTLGKAVKLSDKADYYESKANSVGKAGISADDANAIAKLAQKYKSGVTSAEKRRIIDRVIDIHKNRQMAGDTSKQTDYSNLGFQVERNTDINRLQLKFDGKPEANVRSILKSNGFRWSPREGAWQRQLGGNSEGGLNRVVEQLKNINNSLLMGLDEILQQEPITTQDSKIINCINNILDPVINNSKEQDMALIEELKKLITKVENTKGEEEMEIENEKVDKRKLIDEVGGILKGKVDDEVIRTIIGKMEKMSYDDSEASADNKKVKNEADEEDKKVDNEEDEKEDNKVDNEDEEDEEKVEELKKEEKKDVDNKCKNSKEENYFDKLNKIYNSAKKIEEPSADYESKQARLDAGKEYFG